MEKIKEYKYIVIIGLLILGLVFYWFEYRPSRIIKKCYNIAISGDGLSGLDRLANKYTPGTNQTTKEITYKNCLKDNGLDK